ncbi:MAG: hypothetical protein EXR72_12535 [Myxococcales bacterium]|nr:hypothetical protein [Myxococcales bacterium]
MRLCALWVVAAGCPASSADAKDLGARPNRSACSVDCSTKGKAWVCDVRDGACKLDGTTTGVGAGCSIALEPSCGRAFGAYCHEEANFGFPGGYCSYVPCSQKRPCPIDSTCATLGELPPTCYRACAADDDCRPGYSCMPTDTLWVVGPVRTVCYLPFYPCKKNAHCPSTKPRCVRPSPDEPGQCT